MKAYIAAVAVLALVCIGCNRAEEPSGAAAAPALERPPMAPPAPRVPETIVASGPIVVENQVDVAAQREGVIATIFAQPGTAVHKGQLLAQLDDRQIAADQDAASAKVKALEANLENWRAETKVLQADRSRAEKLYEAQVIPKEQLEHAAYKEEADEYEIKRESEELNHARSVLKSLELERDKTSVTAPFDGRPPFLGHGIGSARGEIHSPGAILRQNPPRRFGQRQLGGHYAGSQLHRQSRASQSGRRSLQRHGGDSRPGYGCR